MKLLKKILSVFLAILTIFTSCSVVIPVFAEEQLLADDNTSDDFYLSEEADCEPEIISEITEKREENAKHFLMSDGTFMVAKYNTPVHYQDKNGQWIDYNNSINEINATEAQVALFGDVDLYQTGNLINNIVFAEKSNSNTLVSYENSRYPISLNYQSSKKSNIEIKKEKIETEGNDKFLKLSNITQEVRYKDIFTNVDLQYIVSPTELKENIILKNKDAQNTFTVNYNIGELNAEVIDSQTINLVDGEDLIYTIVAPYMYDANGAISTDITLTVNKNKNGKLKVIISVDNEWLQAKERVYPVTIDPSIVASNSDNLTATYISSADNSANYGDISSDLHVSKSDSIFGTSYTLLKLENFTNSILADYIVSAKLNLPLNEPPTESVRLYLYEITSDWDETTVTWNTQPTLSSTVTDYCNLSASSTKITFDVTKLYYQWDNDINNSNGVAIKLENNGAVSFCAENDENPVLLLNYISTIGIDDDFSYSEFDMGSAGYVYINNLSGNLVLTRDEIDTTGENYPYDFTNTYNSLCPISDSDTDSLWFKSYQNGFYLGCFYRDSDCSAEILKRTKSDTEEDTFILAENEYGWDKYHIVEYLAINIPMLNVYIELKAFPKIVDVWRNNGAERYRFGLDGLMEKYICENGEEHLVFSRESVYNEDESVNEKICYLVDGDGDKLQISSTDNMITYTQYDYRSDGSYVIGDILVYNKDSNKNITQITLNGKTQATFTYDELNRMTSITNDVGYTLTFTYAGENRRIDSVTESKNGTMGQKAAYERGINSTTVQTSGADGVFGNEDDLYSTYKFNSKAQLVSVQSKANGENLGAVDYEHSENSENTLYGSVSKISTVGDHSNNLLKNHNIESNNYWYTRTILGTDCDYSVGLSDEKSLIGKKSFKISVSDFTSNESVAYTQDFLPSDGVLEAGKTYIFSTYVNTSGVTRDPDISEGSGYGAGALIEVTSSTGKKTRHYSRAIYKTQPDVNDGWERVHLTVTVPENYQKISVNLILRSAKGTAYFDCAQFEEGNTPNEYNLLENNSFNYSDQNGYAIGWSRYKLSSTDVIENGQMKIVGSPDVQKCIYQDVSVSGASQDDTYTFSGWATADSVPSGGSRKFAIYISVFYKDADGNSTNITVERKHFNYCDIEKQHISGSFSLQHETDSSLIPYVIRFAITYHNESNVAFFDDIALYCSSNVYDSADETDDETDDAENEQYTYNDDGTVATWTNEEGVVYTYSYDSLGNTVSILNSEGKGDTFTYAYYDTNSDGKNDESDILTENYEDGSVYTYEYYSDRTLKKEIITSEEETEIYEYNTDGKLVKETLSDGAVWNYTYDSCGNILTKLDADGNGDTYEYHHFDTNNNNECDKCAVLTETLASGEIICYTYDDNGNVTRMSQSKNGKTLAYNYDAEGNLTKVEHNGFEYNYEYDEFGNTTAVKVGNQNLVTYGYQADKSKLSSLNYGNGSGNETYTYNAYGEMVKKDVSGLGAYNFKYDTLGNLVYTKDEVSGRNTYYLYDLEGRLCGQDVITNTTSIVLPNKLFAVYNALDDESRITRKSITGAHYELDTYYSYDENGLISSVATTSSKTRRIDYTYDDEQNLISKSMTTATPVVQSFGYNDDSLVATHTIEAKNGTNAYGYTYDDKGNITAITLNGTVQQSYVYDADGQLIRENNRDINKTVVYTYDGYGNILTKSEYAFTTGTLGAVTDTVTYTYDSVWKDKLTSYDGEAITYDEIGNPVVYRGANLTWNGRKLMSYSENGTNITYKYDADGLRTQKIVNGVKHDYFYEDGQLLYEIKDGVYELYYKYDADGNLFSITRYRYSDGLKSVYYAVTNTRGDVIELRDQYGAIYAKYTYDSWGKLISATNVSGNALTTGSVGYQNSIRYRGYVYDHETGLYYLQSRYYDPEVGRFLNADDVNYIGLTGTNISYNAFAYCGNNAINNKDLSGNAATAILIGIGVGAIVGGIAGYSLSRILKVPKEKRWKYVLGGAVIGGVVGGCVGYAVGTMAAGGSGIVLWSGGGVNGAGSHAANFAAKNGLKTLEMTLKGKFLSKLNSAAIKVLGNQKGYNFMKPLWNAASKQFVKSAIGKQVYINVFISASLFSNESVFAKIEYDVLRNLGMKIIWHFVK